MQVGENYILNVNEEEYIAFLLEKFTINTPRIDFDKIYIDKYEREVPAEQFPQGVYVRSGKTYLKPVIVYYLPFTGNAELFRYTPHQYQLRYPSASIEDDCLCFEFTNFSNNTDEIKQLAEMNINDMKYFMGNLSQEVEAYSTQLSGMIEGMVKSRKQQLLDDRNMLASLGIPFKKRDDLPQTFAIPVTQTKKPLPIQPQVTEKEFSPEPALDQTMYQEILQVIHDTGVVFERNPSIYRGKGEEDLRDYLLLQLTPRFGIEGSATGETFNKTGKTDILIRYKNVNVFIAECKFWGGKNRYFETITQLLGYLTWRDSKAAVVIFVKNKDFSAVLKTVTAVTPEHPNFLGFVSEQGESWYNYRFHLPGDRNRELKLAVMLFHTPQTETKQKA